MSIARPGASFRRCRRPQVERKPSEDPHATAHSERVPKFRRVLRTRLTEPENRRHHQERGGRPPADEDAGPLSGMSRGIHLAARAALAYLADAACSRSKPTKERSRVGQPGEEVWRLPGPVLVSPWDASRRVPPTPRSNQREVLVQTAASYPPGRTSF